ncbi:MAG: YggS family pyridoxal phosphate-dependent enzyme [Mycobacteriales bacterium]|nr:YggS family pyridoxal phosphate-dependent enzyme [Frankia sp.]
MTDTRLAELAANLSHVEARLVAGCAAAGRSRADVTLVAVSKTWPAADVLRLASLGVRDFGENYAAEAATKAASLAQSDVDVSWHFVGHLQRNKARVVAGFAALVHSVDRTEVVAALDNAASRSERVLDVLVQVSLDDARAASGGPRGGVPTTEAARLAADVARAHALRLRGVMGMPSAGRDPSAAFALLREVALALQSDHPEAGIVSAGMSGDLETALRFGATHVRVGTALFGFRPRVSH